MLSVADIAEHRLTPAAARQVATLLAAKNPDFHHLRDVSSWADEIRMVRPETGPWHYVDIPLDAPLYDPVRDCRRDQCIVAQLLKDIDVLKHGREISPERVEALLWVTHLVGDIHQPLHCADNHDKGGNEVPVHGFSRHPNLHRIWDTDFIAMDDPDSENLTVRLEAKITSALAKDWSSSQVIDWANQSHKLAQHVAYGMLPIRPVAGVRPEPEEISDAYRAEATKDIEDRLEEAGVRLADVLNDSLR